MNNWPTKKLGEVIELHYGKGISKYDRKSNGKYPIYGANGELGRTDKYLVEGEAIIVGRKGSAGEVTRVSGKFWPADVTYYILGNNIIDIDFLFYFFKLFDIRRFAVGVKPGINRNRVYEIEIPLPPLQIQKKIVKKIEELFAKISQAQSIRESVVQDRNNLIPAVLQEIFLNTGRNEWPEKQLGELCELNPRNDIKTLSNDTEVSFIPMKYVDDTEGMIKQVEIRKLGVVKKGYTSFRDNDVLFAKITPCMENGKAAHVHGLKNGLGFGSTEFHVIRSKGDILPKLIYYYIRRKSYREEAEKRMTGSAGQKRVPKEFIEKSKIPLPPISEQKEIVEKMDVLTQKVRELQKLQSETAANLTALKQSILHQAFEGRLIN